MVTSVGSTSYLKLDKNVRSLHNDCLHREKISWHVLDEDISENDIRLFEKMVTNVGRTSYLKLDKMQNQKNERYYSYMEGKRQ